MAYKVLMKDYFFIEIELQDEVLMQELENEAFERFNCAGSQDFSVDEEKVDEILGQRSYSGGDLPLEILEEVEKTLREQGENKKKFFFETKAEAVAFNDRLAKKGIEGASLSRGESEDWNETWKKNFKSISIDSKLSIVPSWEKDSDNSPDPKIFIYPGMGFGTGNHETTFLCLKLMLEELENLQHLETCLDYGCGSGILGIAFSAVAEKARKVDYLDIDQQALENCQQNIDLNLSLHTAKKRLLLPQDKKELLPQYDLVFANILKQTLLQESKEIVAKTKDWLIISGLLNGQERDVIEAYQRLNPSLQATKVVTKNDWSAVLLKVKEKK